jgi:stress-induced-phosphoprotein 1
VAKLKLLQSDPKAISSVLGGSGGSPDPRMLEVIGFLLGAELRAGPGGDDDDAGAGEDGGAGYFGGDARSAAEAEEAAAERKAAAAAAAKAAEEEARKASEAAEEAADPELAAKRERKRAAVAKKEEGNAAYKARRFPDALAAYRAAYELDDEDITFLVNQAAVHFETGDLDACVATCRSAIERGRAIFAPYPAIAKAFARIGNAEVKRGALQAAIDAYESSLLESHR